MKNRKNQSIREEKRLDTSRLQFWAFVFLCDCGVVCSKEKNRTTDERAECVSACEERCVCVLETTRQDKNDRIECVSAVRAEILLERSVSVHILLQKKEERVRDRFFI